MSGTSQPAAKKTNDATPEMEEIPDGETSVDRTSGKSAPEVEEIPEAELKGAERSGSNVSVNERMGANRPASTPQNSAQPKVQKTPKPKGNGPGFWGKLGTAINQTVTQPGTPQEQTPQGRATPLPDAQCRGGAYGLGTPPPLRAGVGLNISWSSPFVPERHTIRIYSAGTNQEVTQTDVPQNPSACGKSWPLYLGMGEYDAYLFYGNSKTNPVAGPVRISITR